MKHIYNFQKSLNLYENELICLMSETCTFNDTFSQLNSPKSPS